MGRQGLSVINIIAFSMESSSFLLSMRVNNAPGSRETSMVCRLDHPSTKPKLPSPLSLYATPDPGRLIFSEVRHVLLRVLPALSVLELLRPD